ncbi:cadmium transporter [Bifidobacterium pullorum subsp. saeculare]|uniref:Cadmium transporter n=1 Tax=Bifidobacterium pullorum subsp. saeculare TaxID=78257 RepID=A0A939B926_9BIFI|nr:cadmium transporter [Bifidobacterium pullorum]MBM6699063.1 cadmium transporter [Bifidobacterium pullorum subsp. saeculare]
MASDRKQLGGGRSNGREVDVWPLMPVQAVIIAAVLCFGEICCAPLVVGFVPGVFPVGSWALVACVFAVMFSYVVGFALLWCVESFTLRMRAKFRPLAYAAMGAVGYAVWGLLVIASITNSITAAVGAGVMSNAEMIAMGVSSACLGALAFFAASLGAPTLAKRHAIVVAVAVMTMLLAVAGAVMLAGMVETVA